MKMLGTVVLALSIASGRAHPTPTHEDLNGLPDQTPNEPLSVPRLANGQCIERPYEYFDKETLTCESCGVICGQWGPRSEHCLKEPNCQVDGRWNCNKTFDCVADCDSPTTQLPDGTTVWQGVADCTCEVREDLGGIRCKGTKTTNCTIDIAEKCQRERDKETSLRQEKLTIGFSSAFAIILFLGVLGILGRKYLPNSAVVKRCKDWWKRPKTHGPIQVSDANNEEQADDNPQQPLN